MNNRSSKTSSLFHFTEDLEVLKSIIRNGLIPNFCKEDLCYEDRKIIIGVPMVSFCDIPLTRTSEFKSRYGELAIGLSKDWAIRNQINPILYVNDTRVLISPGPGPSDRFLSMSFLGLRLSIGSRIWLSIDW